MPSLAKLFAVNADELTPTRVQHDDLGMTHIRYEQRKNGLRVVGSDFVVHIGANRAIRSVNGTARDGGALPATPVVFGRRGPRASRDARPRTATSTRFAPSSCT